MASAPAPATRAVEHSYPWMEDGNVVLSAQGKYFRVHRSVLSSYSEVFEDMFNNPHSDEAEEFIEQCPVIQLRDSAADVKAILRALYDRSYPMPPYRNKMPFRAVSTFLRLGEKYGIPALVKEAKVKLCCVSELVDETSFSPLDIIVIKGKVFPMITGADPHNFQIMNLLQEMGLHTPLLLAMLHCISHCPSRVIAEGYEFDDAVHSLSPANLQSFIHMETVFNDFRAGLLKSLYRSPPNSHICGYMSCSHYRRMFLEAIMTEIPFENWEVSKLPTSTDSRWHCEGRLNQEDCDAVRDIWDHMSKALGFNSWREMKKNGNLPELTVRTH